MTRAFDLRMWRNATQSKTLQSDRIAAAGGPDLKGTVRAASLVRKSLAARSVNDMEAILRASPNMSQADAEALAEFRALDAERSETLDSVLQAIEKYAAETGLSEPGGKMSADDAVTAGPASLRWLLPARE